MTARECSCCTRLPVWPSKKPRGRGDSAGCDPFSLAGVIFFKVRTTRSLVNNLLVLFYLIYASLGEEWINMYPLNEAFSWIWHLRNYRKSQCPTSTTFFNIRIQEFCNLSPGDSVYLHFLDEIFVLYAKSSAFRTLMPSSFFRRPTSALQKVR